MNNTYTMKTRPNILETGTPLFCDLYHLTMAQAWFLDGKAEDYKVSEAFFRKCPFGGSYLMTAGLGEFMQWLERWHFSKEDIESLKNDRNEDGSRIFNDEFLQFLEGQELKVTIRAVPEGELVFPNEPVYSVSGPNWQVELAEAALLNIFNAQSLIATKASRMAYAANLDGKKRPLLEFGVRRGHELGGFSETRAAFIGGAAGTSNKAAAKHYGIRAAGTMAHSFVMSYEREVDAFKAFMRGNPHNTTLLVDTYDTREGIKNAIRAAKETGIKLMGIRIDSGDLAYWGNEARRLLCEAEMPDVRLAASNDLDEYLIENLIMVQKAPYDIFAAGTKLVTAYDTPALNVGVTPIELRETVYLCAPFVGFPKTLNALGVINEVFAERGIKLPLESQGKTAEEERFAAGSAIQQPLYGNEIKEALAVLPGNMGEDAARFLTEFCFGDIYTRGGLDVKTRELLAIGILVTTGNMQTLQSHIAGSIRAGNSPETVTAAIIQCMPYVGFPNALNALKVLKDTLK